MNIPIVDTHLHIWDPGKINYPCLSGVKKRKLFHDNAEVFYRI